MIIDNLRKGHLIIMDVYLIKNGFQDTKTTPAGCLLMNDIEKGNQPVQGNFNCTILNVQEPVTSFIYHSSKDISGAPSDKILLNPILTERYISKGELKDYSGANSTNEIIPSFYISKIESKDCKDTGEFSLKGNLSSSLENDIQFELPLAYPINLTATCNIKKSEKIIDLEMICKSKRNYI